MHPEPSSAAGTDARKTLPASQLKGHVTQRPAKKRGQWRCENGQKGGVGGAEEERRDREGRKEEEKETDRERQRERERVQENARELCKRNREREKEERWRYREKKV